MGNNITLDELAKKYGTDKGSDGHLYTNKYSIYLEQYRDLEFNLLEIGVFNGASIKMWKEYFPKANIVALDINPECLQYQEKNITIHIGNQSNIEFLQSIINKYQNFDVIIDDGGHSWKQQIITYETLFPALNRGGLYFVEDMHTSYRPYSEWNDYHITGVNYFKGIVDSVNINGKSFCGYDEIGSQYLNYMERNVEYIHFWKSIIVIGKQQYSL
jgi:hypothetical protein